MTMTPTTPTTILEASLTSETPPTPPGVFFNRKKVFVVAFVEKARVRNVQKGSIILSTILNLFSSLISSAKTEVYIKG